MTPQLKVEILISYNSKASSMFLQECVGGSTMDPWSWHMSPRMIWVAQGCTEHVFTGVNSKSAWMAKRWKESSYLLCERGSVDYNQDAQECTAEECTGVLKAKAVIYKVCILHSQERKGTQYELCQSQKWWQLSDPSCGNIWITWMCWRNL